ncbi:3-isopropylmalate dehydrogenase [Rhodovulum sp. PH10]|uniref:isocitrate/isopropylmalate dehydrogenase family protein n=1 Tax=Rhodovulum sp. PH10 TaxID=1187851 RepID=UPI00027C2DE3|nr:isocitrate/isopropylmalate dehydrogenase family protein [Rhodovulum sp. PH10]EJW09936.1 3-isopropylmalate dehydrogenase [Rhodovulum sp. PH10]
MPKSLKIAVIPGDGIGPEITREAVRVLDVVQKKLGTFELDLQYQDTSVDRYRRTGVAMSDEAFADCKAADAIFLGAIGIPEVRLPDGTEVQPEIVLRLRFSLGLYSGIRPVKYYEGVQSRIMDPRIDYVVMRESTEGLYASRNGGNVVHDEIATDTMVISRMGTARIVRAAAKLARQRAAAKGRRGKVTCVDKANILRSYAFFRKVYDEVMDEFPDLDRDYAYVDAMMINMVLWPERYDVIVVENMFGDIISDLGPATVGGMGMAPSADAGDRWGMFQPSHGSAPTIAGQNIANPIATILSGAMMLNWLDERHPGLELKRAADLIDASVAEFVRKKEGLTTDIGGNGTTSGVGDGVIAVIEKAKLG